jgi:beta-glucosidase
MKNLNRKIIVIITAVSLLLTLSSCAKSGTANVPKYLTYANMSAQEIVSSLTLKQKAEQMVQPANYNINLKDMKNNCYGSVLSRNFYYNYEQWQEYVDNFQKAAIASDAGIPYVYGQDDVHGVNYALNTVLFPHNIGLGAANDEELMYSIGQITADEAKLCHMLWNFAPCLAQSVDPRWGRTYESYGSDLDIITRLGVSYTSGLQDAGLIACAKHFFADGNVLYGTGEKSDYPRIIDRGDSKLDDAKINDLLAVYKAMIDAGVKTIMISHSSLNGVKMHENKEYIDILKNDYGFEGFIVSDWNSVQNTSPSTYYDQIVTGINAGIDMLMEVDRFDEAADIIVKAVENKDISEERIDDAVRRIIQVKLDAGIIADPLCEKMETIKEETGTKSYRDVAERAVEESLVLIKNENEVLPLKSGTTICLIGPAAQNDPAQCGGWTMDWSESGLEDIPGVTSLKEGLELKASDFGYRIVSEEEIDKADVVLVAVGERAYAEWLGDATDLDLCGEYGLEGNKQAIEKAKASGKKTVALIIAGRNVFIKDYMNDFDAVVMCYLPGSEGQGVVNVLCGKADFTGRLPSPWYRSIEEIENNKAWLEMGYGLSYTQDQQDN